MMADDHIWRIGMPTENDCMMPHASMWGMHNHVNISFVDGRIKGIHGGDSGHMPVETLLDVARTEELLEINQMHITSAVIQDKDLQDLISFLEMYTKDLHYIRLCNVRLTRHNRKLYLGTEELLDILKATQLHSSSGSVEVLHLADLLPEKTAIPQPLLCNIIEMVGVNSVNLVHFQCANMGLRANGMEKLHQVLQNCVNLHALDLDKNNIGDDGMIWLCKAIRGKPISYLSVNSNNIGYDGTANLIELLHTIHSETEQTMEYLGMAKNCLTSAASEFLLESLCKNRAVEHVSFYGVEESLALCKRIVCDPYQDWENRFCGVSRLHVYNRIDWEDKDGKILRRFKDSYLPGGCFRHVINYLQYRFNTLENIMWIRLGARLTQHADTMAPKIMGLINLIPDEVYEMLINFVLDDFIGEYHRIHPHAELDAPEDDSSDGEYVPEDSSDGEYVPEGEWDNNDRTYIINAIAPFWVNHRRM